MRRAIILGLVAAAATIVGLCARATPARAGTITAFADNSHCSILGPATNVGGLLISSYTAGCSPIEISNSNEGVYPNSAHGQLISYAPAGIAITSATVAGASADGGCCGTNWWVGSVWNGGGDTWSAGSHPGFTDQIPSGSSYWGFQMWCLNSSCAGGSISASSVAFTAVENRGPSLSAVGGGNIWYQGSHYIWNPPGDPWPLTMSSTDPSGACQFGASVEGHQINSPVWPKNQYAWQQCPSPNVWTPTSGAQIDTRTYVAGHGVMPLTIQAWNAAGVRSSVSETLKVDNDPVRVSLSTPNDPDTQQWVNHAVTVTAHASSGPSGPGGEDCSVDRGRVRPYPAGGVAVNGDGVHHVTCTAWNNAVDPQGAPQSASASQSIAVDESPPSVAIEPQDPSDPTRLVVDTSDHESGVAGGRVQIARAGAQNWTSLPTTVAAGGHLMARFDDAGMRGPYVFRATSCDAVGNCAATDEPLTMPLRLAARSNVSFERIASSAKVVRKRVRVGWRFKRVRRHGKVHRIRVGGHVTTIRVVIHRNKACATKRVRTGRHRWHEFRVCRRLKIRTVSTKRVPYGRKVTLHGLLTTAQGAPVANAPVQIAAAPDNRLGRYAPVATVTTGIDGTWRVKLPAGRSETIKATYRGSLHVLPASGSATMTVPAKIHLSITPTRLPWADFISVHGHLEGGYVPPDGVALRFLVRYPHTKRPTSLLPLRTNSRGQFAFTWSYNGGQGVATYPMWVATTATESDYPFGAAASRPVRVTFGVPTPARQRVKQHPTPVANKHPPRWTKTQSTRHAGPRASKNRGHAR